MYSLRYLLFFSLASFSLSASALVLPEFGDTTILESDTMFLVNQSKGDTVIVLQGQQVKLLSDFGKLQGQYYSIRGDRMVLIIEDSTKVSVSLGHIKFLQFIRSKRSHTGGYFLEVPGATTMALGTFLLLAVFADSPEDIGYGLMGGIPALIVGYGMYRFGDHIQGKKYRIGQKWKIVV